MDRTVRMGERLGLLSIVAVAVAVFLVALPAQASARTTTKITVTAQVTVDNSVAGTTPAAPMVTVKLYRRSGGHWVALSKRVIFYSVDPRTGLLSKLDAKTGSKMTFSLPRRGEYELLYAGSATLKSSRAYTRRMDRVGITAATPTISVTEIDGTWSQVDVAYDVSWNTDAFTGQVTFMYVGVFSTDPDGLSTSLDTVTGQTVVMRYIDEPETVSFSYRVRTARSIGSLLAVALVSPSGDSFIAPDPFDTEPYIYRR